MAKNYSDTYLYSQYPAYKAKMFKFIMECERIDTKSEPFKDIAYEIKRRNVNSSLNKILTSNNVIIGINNVVAGASLPKAFKVFVANDVRHNAKVPKVFIDASDIIYKEDGVFKCKRIEWLISYLISAMTSYIYALRPERLTSNQVIIKDGGEAFTAMMSYVFDRMYKISAMKLVKHQVEYACSLYYQFNLLEKDRTKLDTPRTIALKISRLTKEEAIRIDTGLEDKDYDNIDIFLKSISRVCGFNDLKTSAFVDTWMKLFGTGTVFSLEFFPSFASTMTNTYIGGFIDQQLTIEKVAGRNMVTFTKKVLEIGADNV